MVLKDIPPDARPREKLLALGPAALADAELVALLLRTGLKGVSVLQLAQQLLDHCGGVQGLLHAGVGDLKGVKGLGPAKRAEIAAVIELARRSLARRLQERTLFDSPAQLCDYLQMRLGGYTHEVFAVMFLDAQNRLIQFDEMFRGGLAETRVHVGEVVKRAIELRAAAVVLAHNHPSGVAEPSRADEFITKRLQDALGLIDVKVIDHLVVGHGMVMSFADRGLL